MKTDLAADLTTLFRISLGYDSVEIKSQQAENGILRATIKMSVLNELGLSPHRNEAFHLKVEVSHHKQIGVFIPPVYFKTAVFGALSSIGLLQCPKK